MVVETDYLIREASFCKELLMMMTSAQTSWEQWTDAIYKIENTSYSKTVANIYRRFNEAHEKNQILLQKIRLNSMILFF
jgi:hypothetical protein